VTHRRMSVCPSCDSVFLSNRSRALRLCPDCDVPMTELSSGEEREDAIGPGGRGDGEEPPWAGCPER